MSNQSNLTLSLNGLGKPQMAEVSAGNLETFLNHKDWYNKLSANGKKAADFVKEKGMKFYGQSEKITRMTDLLIAQANDILQQEIVQKNAGERATRNKTAAKPTTKKKRAAAPKSGGGQLRESDIFLANVKTRKLYVADTEGKDVYVYAITPAGKKGRKITNADLSKLRPFATLDEAQAAIGNGKAKPAPTKRAAPKAKKKAPKRTTTAKKKAAPAKPRRKSSVEKKTARRSKTRARNTAKRSTVKLVHSQSPEYKLLASFARMARKESIEAKTAYNWAKRVQKQAAERVIRKSSPFAKLIQQAFDYVNQWVNGKKVEKSYAFTPADALVAQIGNAMPEQVWPSIALLKSFYGMQGQAVDKDRGRRLLTRYKNAYQGAKVKRADPYFGQLEKAMKTLSDYVRGRTDVVELSEAELSGLRGTLQQTGQQ